MPRKGSCKYQFDVGCVYGEFTVIDSEIVRTSNGYATVKVRCSCGNEKMVDAYSLYKGKTTKCYKCNSRKGANNSQWKGKNNIPGKTFSRLLNNAKIRKIVFNITIDDISDVFEYQNKKCVYTGLEISFVDGTASIDRIDSSMGYIKENIQIVHKHINIMKNMFDDMYFKKMCYLVVGHTSSCIDLEYKNSREFGTMCTIT